MKNLYLTHFNYILYLTIQFSLICVKCSRKFSRHSSLKYHISKNVCGSTQVFEFASVKEFNDFRATRLENFRRIKGSKYLKNCLYLSTYCKDYNNQPSSARLRAPSVNKFARTFTNKCDGKLKIHFFADGTVKCFVYGCTNTKHSSINKLEDVEKSYIIEKLKLRMNFTQIRSAFINRFSKNISRYQVNNIKY